MSIVPLKGGEPRNRRSSAVTRPEHGQFQLPLGALNSGGLVAVESINVDVSSYEFEADTKLRASSSLRHAQLQVLVLGTSTSRVFVPVRGSVGEGGRLVGPLLRNRVAAPFGAGSFMRPACML